mgnify:CR=1 FL=1
MTKILKSQYSYIKIAFVVKGSLNVEWQSKLFFDMCIIIKQIILSRKFFKLLHNLNVTQTCSKYVKVFLIDDKSRIFKENNTIKFVTDIFLVTQVCFFWLLM